MTLDDALGDCPIVAILRGIHTSEAADHCAALFEAGVRAVEIPLNSPDPLQSIAKLAAGFGDRMAVGAGTVLSADQVAAVADARAQYLVAPNTDAAVIQQSLLRGLAPAPGFATATEAFAAYAAGARRLKLFPATTYGASHLRQLKAVLPADTAIWAVGGVRPDTMAEWWAAGARAFGLGGELYRPGQSPLDTRDKARLAVAAATQAARG